jgi:hypothetical protein
MHDNDDQNLPVHPVYGPALAVLDGVPVWLQCGAADDDDDGAEIDLTAADGKPAAVKKQSDILDDEPDEDDEPEDESDKDDKAPPAKKPAGQAPAHTAEDFERLEKALTAERAMRKKRESMIAEFRKAERAAATSGDDAAAQQVRDAADAAAAKYKPVAIRSAAKAALLEANFQNPTDERIKKMIKRLDIDDIDVDDDGDIIGLEGQIESLVDDFPELFTAPTAAAPTVPAKVKPPKISTANKPPAKVEYATTGERLAAKITAGEE